MDFSLTGLNQLPQHNRCCHNTNYMALKHKKHTISNHVYAFDLHSYDWHNNPFFCLANTRERVIRLEYALCLTFLLYCSCFSLECSLAYINAFSRFSFIFCTYFFGCNPKRVGKLMSPVQLSFNTANGPRGKRP